MIGYAPTYLAAEIELNSLVHDILIRTAVANTADVPDEDVEDVLAALADADQTHPAPAAAVANAPIIAIELGQTNASIEPDSSLVFTPII